MLRRGLRSLPYCACGTSYAGPLCMLRGGLGSLAYCAFGASYAGTLCMLRWGVRSLPYCAYGGTLSRLRCGLMSLPYCAYGPLYPGPLSRLRCGLMSLPEYGLGALAINCCCCCCCCCWTSDPQAQKFCHLRLLAPRAPNASPHQRSTGCHHCCWCYYHWRPWLWQQCSLPYLWALPLKPFAPVGHHPPPPPSSSPGACYFPPHSLTSLPAPFQHLLPPLTGFSAPHRPKTHHHCCPHCWWPSTHPWSCLQWHSFRL
mmetsp:Transcript_8423/g.20933  ORF Transcript_8423/g.20933 Transcript_8423/m.20933 type:complete len:257 (+) Transcript_8423:1226-1996(+)